MKIQDEAPTTEEKRLANLAYEIGRLRSLAADAAFLSARAHNALMRIVADRGETRPRELLHICTEALRASEETASAIGGIQAHIRACIDPLQKPSG